jgi:exoribonuclease-2
MGAFKELKGLANPEDLDQPTVAKAMPADKVKILVAVADVDSFIDNGLVIDEHACHNTTSVYTGPGYFQCFLKAVHGPHLPEFQ